MNKLTKAQKAQFPEFVLEIDYKAGTGKCYGYKVLEAKTLLQAMCESERVIRDNYKDIYLVDLFSKSGGETDNGEPLYETALMTRVHANIFDDGAEIPQWHFRDYEHGETKSSAPCRYSNGSLIWYRK